MPAPDSIRDLVQRFQAQSAGYHKASYNETELRRDFLDPFFAALGWDMTNTGGGSEKYREVIHEASVEVQGAAKAADYAFRMGGNNVFFVEAKKPAVNIAASGDAAFQLRSYGWSGKLALSLLTDFEQLAVYDCRDKPKIGEAAHVGRVSLYHYTEYVDRWDEIHSRFSREAVFTGKFDAFAGGTKGKKGTTDVDDAFLAMLEGWRELLARNIALRNPGLSVRDLNFAVQTTIDRIIFLRICEDRGIEAEDALRGATDGKDIYQDLLELFKTADRKYNSGLFHFNAEKGESSPADTLTPGLKIDDKVLKDILAGLYHPSPYAFKYIPADILGQVYERFLGRVIRLTAGHTAKVEEKPEVRKAGGVYYTPTYIVEYIVKNTLGELLQGETPETQQVKPLRVLDPACGSGSFLLGAYQYLLDWYLEWYAGHEPARWTRGKNPAVVEAQGGWQLTMEKKKEILLAHIFGVDIDQQAVEVTKLSLLLKVVENPGQLSLLEERILPDLGENVKCGNSLIGQDYYSGRQMAMFGDEEFYRVNAFDWQDAFRKVFAQGGFDAVIGNPPYVRSINLKKSDPNLWDFYHRNYFVASEREWDIYLVFVEKTINFLNKEGRLGFILPNKFLNSQVGRNLRSLLASKRLMDKIIHFGAFQVFSNVTTYTCLLFLNYATEIEQFNIAKYIGPISKQEICPLPEVDPKGWKEFSLPKSELNGDNWNFTSSSNGIFQKIDKWPKLGNLTQVFKGTGTNADKVFFVHEIGHSEGVIKCQSAETGKEYLLEANYLKKALRGRHIHRYHIEENNNWLISPYHISKDEVSLILSKEFAKNSPKTWEYLRECKSRLDERENGRFKNSGWYCFGRPQNMNRFDEEKIILPDVVNRGEFFLDENGYWILDTAYAISVKPGNKENIRYILGILNSPLLTYYLKQTGTALRGGYFRLKTSYLNPFPIRTIDFNDPADVKRHERMVALVENMLGLHKRLAAAGSPQEKELLQRQIGFTDREIDALVYELYGLTEEEIKIVEGA